MNLVDLWTFPQAIEGATIEKGRGKHHSYSQGMALRAGRCCTR